MPVVRIAVPLSQIEAPVSRLQRSVLTELDLRRSYVERYTERERGLLLIGMPIAWALRDRLPVPRDWEPAVAEWPRSYSVTEARFEWPTSVKLPAPKMRW